MLSQSPHVYALPAGVREAMLAAGMTQSKLARLAGINRTVLSEWINGTRELRRDRIVIVADRLGVPPEKIATDRDRCEVCGARGVPPLSKAAA